jgi:hypothetical protein
MNEITKFTSHVSWIMVLGAGGGRGMASSCSAYTPIIAWVLSDLNFYHLTRSFLKIIYWIMKLEKGPLSPKLLHMKNWSIYTLNPISEN